MRFQIATKATLKPVEVAAAHIVAFAFVTDTRIEATPVLDTSLTTTTFAYEAASLAYLATTAKSKEFEALMALAVDLSFAYEVFRSQSKVRHEVYVLEQVARRLIPRRVFNQSLRAIAKCAASLCAVHAESQKQASAAIAKQDAEDRAFAARRGITLNTVR